ncbi:MAG: hypothetical protein UR73_C0016G0006 [candidate division WS6 bacterium GW2011_GWF1_35_23]|uniref:Uncharacterized protein n=1 Tax=candidate division WS6 bacterium GW2011_GWF1_35_23 TaxID=1619097 RepID=A0A0G0ER10_9BACT|nr:MAG: hypothetical protein UR73_C0016G0006 [candidate division WS6 bacterium GW2011_GWF1_35_23]
MLLLNKQFEFLKTEKVQLVITYSLAILLPLLIPKPQILLGTLINALFIFSVTRFGLKKTIPLLLIPSILSYTQGLLFGSSTIFLLYLIPFIAISNFALIYLYKKINIPYVNILISASIKALILYSAVLLLMKLTNMPQAFLQAMGMIQFITALLGTTIVTLV